VEIWQNDTYLTNLDEEVINVVLVVHAVDTADNAVTLQSVDNMGTSVVGPRVKHSFHAPWIRVT
jgi:hypothetical protein